MTTINQEIFSQITGFEGSWSNGGASQDYEGESLVELTKRASDTMNSLDLMLSREELEALDGEFDENKVAAAVLDFSTDESGESLALDSIYIKLGEELKSLSERIDLAKDLKEVL